MFNVFIELSMRKFVLFFVGCIIGIMIVGKSVEILELMPTRTSGFP